MPRPCFLVIDPEHSGSISTRKLVIESAKFNVITAYTGAEAIETLKKYPAVDGVVTNAGIEDMPARDLIRALKQLRPTLPVIVVTSPTGEQCEQADYLVETFEPKRLLDLLQSLQPEQTAVIGKRDVELKSVEDKPPLPR